MYDMTYCGNSQCPFQDCYRHVINAPICVPVSYAMLDATCQRWLNRGAKMEENNAEDFEH